MELLAPAGGMEQLKSAVKHGASAVYLGAAQFSARKNAANFSDEELKEAVSYCHARDVDVHLAVNTLVRDSEFTELKRTISFAREIGIDAFIVQDLGVLNVIREIAGDVPLHASTQMTVHNLSGAKWMQELGFSRVVLARELSLEEIAYIAKHISIEVEVFVHGAICVCYSGQCLLSSMMGGRSGNRGGCAQPCRLPQKYSGVSGYYLSPADLCHINYLSQLKEAGITSLKIEGRMKGPEYVGLVTNIYRKYLDHPKPISKQDETLLKAAFCRGDSFTDGYIKGETGASMMRPTVSNDRIHEKTDSKAINEYLSQTPEKRIPIHGYFYGKEGELPFLSVWDTSGNEITVYGESPLETAKAQPVNDEVVRRQLNKTGDTPFVFQECTVQLIGNCFLPIKELNRFRREALDGLLEKRVNNRMRSPRSDDTDLQSSQKNTHEIRFTAWCERAEQAEALARHGCERIYLSLYAAMEWGKEGQIISLPPILHDSEWNQVKETLIQLKPDALVCTNVGQVLLAKELNCKIYGGYQLNIMNRNAISLCEKSGFSSAMLSVEQNVRQLREMKGNEIPTEVIVYGHLPLMITENCIIKTAASKCNCKENNELVDRTGARLLLRPAKGKACRTEILNAQPIYMADRMKDVKECSEGAVLYFSIESPGECVRVWEEYTGKIAPNLPKEFTRGHFYRGAE